MLQNVSKNSKITKSAKIGYVCVTKRVQKQQNFKKCQNRIRLCYKTCPKTAKFQNPTFLPTFWQKSWKKDERFPYNRESAPLPGSKWLPHIHETAHFNILLILAGRRSCRRRLRRCGIRCRTVLFNSRAGRYLILDIVSQRLLAARTVYESVRIPTSVPQIISMVIEFIAAILASAVENRIIAFISRYRVGINHSCILEPGS